MLSVSRTPCSIDTPQNKMDCSEAMLLWEVCRN